MTRNPLPEIPKIPDGASDTALNALLTGRTGWKRDTTGTWTHRKTGLTIEPRSGSSAFKVKRPSGAETTFATRAGLELHLAGAGA